MSWGGPRLWAELVVKIMRPWASMKLFFAKVQKHEVATGLARSKARAALQTKLSTTSPWALMKLVHSKIKRPWASLKPVHVKHPMRHLGKRGYTYEPLGGDEALPDSLESFQTHSSPDSGLTVTHGTCRSLAGRVSDNKPPWQRPMPTALTR